jgi:CheY-like chemotaxis protein
MVELPLMIAQASAASEAPPADAGGAPLAGVRVLVVDDDADARALLQRVLKEAGAQVACASDASEGLAALSRIRPDVLLSDIGMSGMDGYAFVRRVRELSPEEGRDIPAAAITAYAREEDRAEAMKAGFQAHLGKPVMSDEVVAVVRSLARRGPRYTIG